MFLRTKEYFCIICPDCRISSCQQPLFQIHVIFVFRFDSCYTLKRSAQKQNLTSGHILRTQLTIDHACMHAYRRPQCTYTGTDFELPTKINLLLRLHSMDIVTEKKRREREREIVEELKLTPDSYCPDIASGKECSLKRELPNVYLPFLLFTSVGTTRGTRNHQSC